MNELSFQNSNFITSLLNFGMRGFDKILNFTAPANGMIVLIPGQRTLFDLLFNSQPRWENKIVLNSARVNFMVFKWG